MIKTEVAIIGGGLAGLTAAIHLSSNNISVSLFEKEDFPHHKVCGEYVSNEILPYFKALGIPIENLHPAEISRLQFSTVNGKSLNAPLPLGGMGISRFSLDNLLYRQALSCGAKVIRAQIAAVEFSKGKFKITTSEKECFSADLVLGAYGKRANLDKVLGRSFFKKPAPWLAVKSHYKKEDFPKNQVGLHNFNGGYCGLSKTETGAVNVCYLATYKSFKPHKSPEVFKELVLRKNPFLNDFFSGAVPIFEHPLSIAQVSFSPKTAVEDHMLMLGDAAGLLHPLCGNGMAMAIHSAKIASELLLKHLHGPNFKRKEMEQEYKMQWNMNFNRRIQTGVWLQKILLNQNLSKTSLSLMSKMPFLLPYIIKRTHGKPIS